MQFVTFVYEKNGKYVAETKHLTDAEAINFVAFHPYFVYSGMTTCETQEEHLAQLLLSQKVQVVEIEVEKSVPEKVETVEVVNKEVKIKKQGKKTA